MLDAHCCVCNVCLCARAPLHSTGTHPRRIILMPIDTCKTIMQVEGKNGLPALKQKLKLNGPTVLYHGAIAASAATFVG
jgi:hypothetical protein